jgi:hypothetical protein
MSKLKYGLGAIVIIGGLLGSVPYFTKDTVDTLIEKQQQSLSTHGMDFKVVSHEGYLDSKREITLKFKDTTKVMDYFEKTLLVDKSLLNAVTKNGELFSKVSFKGILKNKNVLPYQVESVLMLDELPVELQEAMEKDKVFEKFVKSLALKINFSIYGEVVYIALNDIVIEDKDIVAKLIKPEMKIRDNRYDTNIENITFNVKKKYESLKISVDEVKDRIIYKDEFNFDGKAHISQIKFNFKEKQRSSIEEFKFESSQNIIKTKMSTSDNNVAIHVGYNINNVLFSMNNADTKIDKFVLDFKFNDIKEEPLRLLNESFTNKYDLSKILEPTLQEIVNNGLSMSINSKIKNTVNSSFTVNDIGIDLSFKLDKNDINLHQNVDYVMKYLSIDGKISLDKSTVDKISILFPISKYNTNIIKNTSTFDIKYEKNNLFVNGQKI